MKTKLPKRDPRGRRGDDVPDTSPVGQRVQAYRRRRGWSQATLADQVGCSFATISRIESGAALPSIAVGMRLAAEMKISINRLYSSGFFADVKK